MRNTIITFALTLLGLGAFAQTPVYKTATAALNGTNALLRSGTDTYNIKDSLAKGRYQTVKTLANRDAIPSNLREVGMLVRVTDIDSTYVLSGGITNANWTLFSSGITASVLSDSLSRYARLSDGVVAGLTPTTNGDSLLIASGTYRLNGLIKTATSYIFGDIPLSDTGLARILVVYGNNTGVLDTLSGVQSTNPVAPTVPTGTTQIASLTVFDGFLGTPTQDLSNFVTLNSNQIITGVKEFKNSVYLNSPRNQGDLFLKNDSINLFSFYRNLGDNFVFSSYPDSLSGGNLEVYKVFRNTGVFDFVKTPTVNGIPLGTGAGTVTGITTGLGLLGGTINTSGTISADTAVLRTVANSYSLSTGQPKLTGVNFGNFMDVGLATKLTPTSGDFLLGRDILTNEAVEVPFSTVQPTLVSGNNIKTINGNSLLDSGDLSVENVLNFSTGLSRVGNTVTNTGVTSITGTTNQVITSASTGAITLSLPQSISTTSSPTFANQTITGLQSIGTDILFTSNAGNGLLSANATRQLTITNDGIRVTNIGAGIAPNANFGFTGAASTTTTAPFLITPGVAYTGTQNGALWYETTNSRLRMYRNSSVSDVVTTGSNILFAGTSTAPVRVVTATTDGSLAATTPIIETYNTDTDVITAITGATYNKANTFSATLTPANGKVFYKGQLYKSSTYLYFATADNVAYRSSLYSDESGWAAYNDTQYTVGSPLSISSGTTVTLPNNSGTSVKTQLPIGVTDFYNSATSKITPANNGDYYQISVLFKAKSTVSNDYFDISIDVGGAIGQIFKQTLVLVKGANTEQSFKYEVGAYAAATFLANGGLVKITSVNGTLSVYDIIFQVNRTHKAF